MGRKCGLAWPGLAGFSFLSALITSPWASAQCPLPFFSHGFSAAVLLPSSGR